MRAPWPRASACRACPPPPRRSPWRQPCRSIDKDCEYAYAALGASALETTFGALMELVAAGDLSLPRAVAALTHGPAGALARPRDAARGTLAARPYPGYHRRGHDRVRRGRHHEWQHSRRRLALMLGAPFTATMGGGTARRAPARQGGRC